MRSGLLVGVRRATHRAAVRCFAADAYDEAGSLLSSFMSQPRRPKAAPTPPPEQPVAKPRLPERPILFPEHDGESAVDREIRAHNSSLYDLKGQALVGRVVAVGKKDVLVDLGWKDCQTFLKSELSQSQIYRDDSAANPDRDPKSFEPGDTLRFRIEELATPHGEIFVSTQKMRADVRKRLVWEELVKAFKDGVCVCGRVLNPCNAGYAIGVAGFVAFCPLQRISPRVAHKIGISQSFEILQISEQIGRNFVVVDPHVKVVNRRGPRFSPHWKLY